jgi:hypothetical protein
VLGKDVLDGLFRFLKRDGAGEIRGWSRDHFHSVVRRELAPTDLQDWTVGQRIIGWAEQAGYPLMADTNGD